MSSSYRVLVALSGGVDSAVAAWLLARQGFAVECLHMSNWDDDDGYCEAAEDLRDARRVAKQLGVTLHCASFAPEYRNQVFAEFLSEIRSGRTPNPDVLCNREIKFGVLQRYARRLGAVRLATGHYARLGRAGAATTLLRGKDGAKDQSYFLHAVHACDLADVMFPLGDKTKNEVRELARQAGFEVADKADSTGICFIGERPFGQFLSRFIDPRPGPIVNLGGDVLGEHQGLHRYTLGQRKGLGIGGVESADDGPWFVAAKRTATNELVVVQGHDHPALFSDWLATDPVHWIGPPPLEWTADEPLRCQIKTRYRQQDQAGELLRFDGSSCRVSFDRAQRAVTPGQYAVFYQGDRCLGGARIRTTGTGADVDRAEAKAQAG